MPATFSLLSNLTTCLHFEPDEPDGEATQDGIMPLKMTVGETCQLCLLPLAD